MTIGGEDIGKIVIGLFGDDVPMTVKNFVTIATKGINGTTYAGSKFHRIIPRQLIQGIIQIYLLNVLVFFQKNTLHNVYTFFF